MRERPQILIIGGGIIGCACAHVLAERGIRVTLIDKGEIGHGCSYGNAGWIVPGHAVPLPMPGAWMQTLSWLLTRDGPVTIRPRLDWEMAAWFARFARHANRRHFTYALPVLTELARRSLELYREFDGRFMHSDTGFRTGGLLFVCATRKGLRQAVFEQKRVAELGCESRALDADQVRSMEPAVTGKVAGGVWYPNEAHAEPLRMVQALARVAEGNGATILARAEVIAFEQDGRSIAAVRTTRGRFEADRYILAAGAWTPQLARMLRLRVPIQAGKGYAVILPPMTPSPAIPMLLMEKKIAVTPRDGSVRLAGTMEFAGLDESVTVRRVDALIRGARKYMDLPEDAEPLETWRGLRPCTPDGIPLIGRHGKIDNLYLAAGHAMQGLTLGAGTGRLIADLVTGREPQVDPTPFRPDRF